MSHREMVRKEAFPGSSSMTQRIVPQFFGYGGRRESIELNGLDYVHIRLYCVLELVISLESTTVATFAARS
jgi:hypothetical protein